MKTKIKALAVMAVALSSALPAVGASPWVVSNGTTKTECSACHTLYAPGFLPKRSWQAIMGDLSNHFGEDASLGDAARTEIENYLVSQAPQDVRGLASSATPLRITELPWYTREHGPRFVLMPRATPKWGPSPTAPPATAPPSAGFSKIKAACNRRWLWSSRLRYPARG